ncbi:MAG: hypothetical protein MPN21_02495 [Thermoanaerobaculia bacterium]|nr:hypothetical protein [Thermoanaerobaculia bacterium]
MSGRGFYSRAVRIVVIVYLLVGAAWTIVNLGDIPHYGDTHTYFQFAQDVRVNEQRGVVYPWILSQAVHRLLDGQFPGTLHQQQEIEEPDRECAAPQALAAVQILQWLVGAAALWFFLRLTVRRNADATTSEPVGRTCLLALLLLFDPMINHFHMAFMTDGLTLAACLAFLAALAAIAERKGSMPLAYCILVASYLLAGGLRVEKKWLLLGTFALTSALWASPKWRSRFPDRLARRLGLAAVLLVVGLASVVVAQDRSHTRNRGLSSYETFVHLRIGFPHLSEIYEDLPERSKARLSREYAELYDTQVNDTRKAVLRATQRDEGARRELAEDVLRTVLPEKWGSILVDSARDASENILSTGSLYLRLATWYLGGYKALDRWFFSDGSVWNYQRMAFHHPLITGVYVGLGGALLLLAAPLAWRYARQRKPGPSAALWTPCIVFILLNALFFAAIFNYVNFRYSLVAHVAFLIFLFRPMIESDP